MPDLDRSRLVMLLDQLGDEKDDVALAAAREASRMVRDAGEGWEGLLVPEEHESADVEVEVEAEAAPAAPAAASGDQSDIARAVERLLARKDISDTLRSDLKDFRQAIAEGKLDRMDADYIRALTKRLGA